MKITWTFRQPVLYINKPTRAKERNTVVSAWWLLLTFFAGGYAGILLMALMAVARESEPESVGARRRARGSTVPAGPNPNSAIDWVI
jgi:hypothetical protein